MTLIHHLQIVGLLMFGIVLLNFGVWKRFKWREEIQKLTTLTRQVFIVHSFYIMLTVGAFGVLSLGYPGTLTEPSPLAKLVLVFLVVFWGSRLFMQWCVYDRSLWRGRKFETFIHFAFSGVWLYFTLVYGIALSRQW